MEGKGDNIIRVTNTRGATIKVSISEIDRCTREIIRLEKKSYLEDLKFDPSPKGNIGSSPYLPLALHEFFSI
jgi:hypothetical protein